MTPQDNKITVAGDGNITIQNVHGSTITLNANNPAILKELEALQSSNAAAFQSLMEVINKRQEPTYQNLKNTLINSKVFAKYVHIGDIYNLPSESKLPKDLTLHIPKIHPDEIIGREAELTDLHDLLFDNQRVVVVNGLGGIGKTTLAQAYIGQYYTAYQHIVWLSQLSENIVQDLINAEGLSKQLLILTEGKDPQAIFLEIIRQLKSITDTPNLFVLDNADATLTQLYDLLPTQPGWHVLVTSRSNIERFYTKELDFLSPQKALALFQKHCTRITDEAAIQTILKTIDYHTLTIEILAKTAQKQRTDIAALQTAIETDLKANVFVAHKGDKIDKVRSYLASIFDFSHTSTHEQWLLKQMVCLPPEYHTYTTLEELINPAASERTDIFSETLEELADQGWLLHNPNTDTYKMHRIIAEVASQKLPLTLAEVEPLIEMVTEKLSLDDTKDNPIDKFPWIPFGKAILVHFPEETANQIAVLQNNLATVLKDLGDYQGAKDLLQKALASNAQNFGENHPSTARSYSNLAVVLQDLGDYQGAKDLLQKAVASAEQNFGENHPSTAGSYSNLAVVLKDLGDYQGAKDLLQKATASNEQNFGENHPSTAGSYSNLATVLQALGDYQGAKDLLQKAVASAEQNFGENHPTTAVSYSNLALVLQDLGDYAGAIPLLEKAYAVYQHQLGEQHPTTKIIKGNLDGVLQASKQTG